MGKAWISKLLSSSAGRYLVIGGSSFVVDLGLLTLFFRVFDWPLWAATGAGFWGSFFYNYFLQRRFSFRTQGSVLGGFAKYSAVLLFNTIATMAIVEFFQFAGAGFVVGKVVSTGLTTIWNYYLYKLWVFAHRDAKKLSVTSVDPETSQP
ncbi:GtrA family protein [Specibacter cremeus]|uniref:GtrA family protein n=1 Tax=Specibacter cremeus TaxID=1629051 RepID=UPI000F794D68|nr:GtrA family protein [Specibacter cremeus]